MGWGMQRRALNILLGIKELKAGNVLNQLIQEVVFPRKTFQELGQGVVHKCKV